MTPASRWMHVSMFPLWVFFSIAFSGPAKNGLPVGKEKPPNKTPGSLALRPLPPDLTKTPCLRARFVSRGGQREGLPRGLSTGKGAQTQAQRDARRVNQLTSLPRSVFWFFFC